jgi:hypothetical protein
MRWVLILVLLAGAVVTFMHLGLVGQDMPFEYYRRYRQGGPQVSVTWNYYTGAFEWKDLPPPTPEYVPAAPPGVAVRYWLLSALFIAQFAFANVLIFNKSIKEFARKEWDL